MNREILIDATPINDEKECYVIAEVGHNHQGKLDTAFELFRAAKECGASAVKLQKRHNKSLYTKAMYNQPYENENSFGATYGEHRQALEFEYEQYVDLKQYAKELGITFFATAFDFSSADFLAKVEVPAFKVASGDLRNVPLLRHIARFQKPMIVSTGGAELDDVQRAYDAVMPINSQVCILQCTAGYPAAFNELDLKVICTFRNIFQNAVIGLSSHDNGIAMAVAAYVLGARIVEKHFTLNRAMKGTDHAFSLEPVGLRKMVRDLRRTREALGNGQKKIYPSEIAAIKKMGKKIVVAHSLPAGHVLTPQDLALRSPGDGLPPYEMENVLGKKILLPLEVDDPISWDNLK